MIDFLLLLLAFLFSLPACIFILSSNRRTAEGLRVAIQWIRIFIRFISPLCRFTWQTIRKALGLRTFRASAIVAASCVVSVWLSDEKIETLKDLASVLYGDAEPIAISSAAAVFLIDSPERRKAEQYEAWQVINSALGQTGSGGRIQALEDLNRNQVDLEGVAVPNADLSGVKLGHGRLQRANFKKAKLDQASLYRALLDNANFEGADLRGANLEGAELTSANLSGADLSGANLSRATLLSADLKGAILKGTIMRRARLSVVNDSSPLLGDPMSADCTHARLEDADLSFVDLINVKGLTELQVTEALLYETSLPQDIHIDPLRDGEKLGYEIRK